jgi:hypothetical protein
VSVAWTDLLQGILMVFAVFLALTYMTFDLGGITEINLEFAELDSALVHPTNEGNYTLLYVAGLFLAFFGTILTEQDMLIRIAATRNMRTAKIHIAAAGVDPLRLLLPPGDPGRGHRGGPHRRAGSGWRIPMPPSPRSSPSTSPPAWASSSSWRS